MIKIILDSNFLFVPFQFRIDIFDELTALLGRYEAVILSTTIEELESLLKKRSEKMRRQASSALELAKRCMLVKIEKKAGESFDDVILRIAAEWKCPVATNDRKLRKRLREKGIATVYLRQKTRLAIEGALYE